MFKQIQGENAIIVRSGVYRQCDLYERAGEIFARVGNGFVRLYADGSTSQPKTSITVLAFNGNLFADRLGRLTIQPGENFKRISVTNEGALQIEDKSK